MPDFEEDDSQRRFFPPPSTPRGAAASAPEAGRRAAAGGVVLKVSTHSNPVSVAGALANEIRARGTAEIRSVGAGALNQAVKAIAIARGYVAPQGIDIACVPGFSEIEIDGNRKTALTFTVFRR